MENSVEKNIENLICDSLSQLGYILVRVKFFSTSGKKTLQVMIEREDNVSITLEDCERVSHHISPLLDLEEYIESEYDLEISSAGIDRPLVKVQDFKKYTGYEVKIKTLVHIKSKKNFSGRIISVENDIIEIRLTNEKENITIKHEEIESANLVLTDELISKTKH